VKKKYDITEIIPTIGELKYAVDFYRIVTLENEDYIFIVYLN